MSASSKGEGVSPRAKFICMAVPCLLNCLAMVYVAFGAAAGGPRIVLVWPALILLAIGILMLGAIAAVRAREVGVSPALAFIAVVLTTALGPAVFVPLIVLAAKRELPSRAQTSAAWAVALQSVLLLAGPWVILAFFRPDGG